jgi:hypothetical protein
LNPWFLTGFADAESSFFLFNLELIVKLNEELKLFLL